MKRQKERPEQSSGCAVEIAVFGHSNVHISDQEEWGKAAERGSPRYCSFAQQQSSVTCARHDLEAIFYVFAEISECSAPTNESIFLLGGCFSYERHFHVSTHAPIKSGK
ncbi:hypothetical protein GPALN_002985 [Globodera pallida]|nr:hypothetical protein GPALN_002985 [Globodera pallida]